MSLSNELISQFVKATKDTKKTADESTVYGTTVVYGGKTYVKLDGSDLLTPVSTTTDVKDNERVTVMIKNHTATITGNMSSPSARTDDVQVLGNKITEAEILIADKVSTEQLEVERGRIDTLVSDNVTIREKLTANEAEIDTLVAENATITEKLTANEAAIKNLDADKISADAADIVFAEIDNLYATNAYVHNLEATYGEFQELTATNFNAVNATIKDLETEKLSAEQADLKYANIDFTNIGEAAIDTFYAKSGIIDKITISEGVVVKELVGVTIKGDLIEAGTLKADKLVVKGSDGLYYKLNVEAGATTSEEVSKEELQNGLHGTAIIAKTITAEKISVDDLVAFDATIGGFHITDTSIHSGVKSSVENTTTGIYFDNEGQLVVGDSSNFIKYFKDTDGNYNLIISADSILLNTQNKSIESIINETIQNVHNSLSELAIENGKIKANVSNVENQLNDITGELESTRNNIADLTLTSNSMNVQIEDIIYNGVSKVTTKTGFTFDDEGMMVDRSDSLTKTQITPDGMTVYTKDANGDQSEVLEATSEGVNATNLHANTYFVIGGRSRFENYGADRTGCFWIGG